MKRQKGTTMKKSELKFKVALLTPQRAGAIIRALIDIGVKIDSEITWGGYIRVTDGLVCVVHWIENFIAAEEPEVTYQQAINLITQVEPEPEEGFVEFEVNADGMFSATWKKGRQKTYWPNVASVECNSCMELVFAGWVWEDKGSRWISLHRQGFNRSSPTCSAMHWEKPAQPVSVRFWRKNK